jgi:hypothetical protein
MEINPFKVGDMVLATAVESRKVNGKIGKITYVDGPYVYVIFNGSDKTLGGYYYWRFSHANIESLVHSALLNDTPLSFAE